MVREKQKDKLKITLNQVFLMIQTIHESRIRLASFQTLVLVMNWIIIIIISTIYYLY